MVQLDSGSGGSGSESEVDEELQQSQETSGSLAEPEVDQVSREMSTAQDRDLQEVQSREQQSVSPSGTTATVDGGGAQQPPQTEAEPVEASAPETTATPTTGTPGGEVTEPTANEVQAPEPADVEQPDSAGADGTDGSGAQIDPTITRGETGQAIEKIQRSFSEQLERPISRSDLEITREDGRITGRLSGALESEIVAERSREAARDAGLDFGEQAARAEERSQIEGSGAAVESGGIEVGTTTIRDIERDALADQRQSLRRALEGIGAGQQQAASQEAIEGRRSGAAASASAQPQRIERQLERQIEEETGRTVDLERGDFSITNEGQVELTQSGQDKVATAPLTGFVEEQGIDIRPAEIEVVEGPFEGAFPGAGLIGAGVEVGERESLGAVAEGVGEQRDFGDFFGGMTVTQFGERQVVPGPRIGQREVVGEKTVDEVLAEISAEVDDLVVVGDPAFEGVTQRRGRAGAAARQEAQQFTGVGFEEVQGFSESFIEFVPRVAAGAPQLAVNVGDFGAEFVGAVSPEFGERQQVAGPRAGARPQQEGADLDRVDELIADAEQTAINAGAVFAADFAEDPSVTGARAAGGLAASAVTFGAAAAIGPRTSLATRAAIQPGEEALGFGGFGATRAIAGRSAAQRLFPNKEPLVFSEEAFLRGVRGVGRRVGDRVPRIEFESMGESNVEGLLTELRTEGRIQRRRIRQRGRDPRQLVEGPVIASGPRAIGRADLGEGEFVIRERFDGETEVDTEVSEDVDAAEEDAGTDGAGQVGGGGFDLEFEQETGTGQAEVLRMRVEETTTELDMPSEAEFERARSDPIGLRVQPGELGMETPGQLGTEAPVEAPAVTEAVGEVGKVGPGLDELLDQEFAEVLPPQLEFRPRESEIERTPAELELQLELAEQEIERSELELELEQEAEFRRELEGGRDRGQREEGLDTEMSDEVFSRSFRFERTQDPFADIESDLEDIDKELEDLG